MNGKREKWKTWWWYHKTHVFIAFAVIAVLLYSFLPGMLAEKPDYSIALITTEWVPEDVRDALKERIGQIVDDRNGDGRILVELNYYQADLSGRTAGTENYLEASRLDADLVGKISGIILTDDPDGFRENTAVPIETEIPCDLLMLFHDISLPRNTVFTVRTDGNDQGVYERMIEIEGNASPD